jgi:protein phosphatase
MIENGEITPDEIYTHPQRNVIFRFLGQKDFDPSDVFTLDLRKGDCLLLCSDGLWEMVHSDDKIVEIIEKARTPKKACKRLISAANDGGGEDNIGVVVVKIS